MNATELKRKRERLDLTQEQLAKKVGVSRHTVLNWEKEIVQIPRPVQIALETIFADYGG
jgi:DNA-binding XRE family transcriptional regulator